MKKQIAMRRQARLLLISIAVLAFTATTGSAGGGGGNEPYCAYFANWRENDSWPFPDTPAHTGDLEYDPNTEFPEEEWYAEGLVTREVTDETFHTDFTRGEYAATHHPQSCAV